MKYLSDPVKTKGSRANSLATPGESLGLIGHVILAILVDGGILTCEAQVINVEPENPCPLENACVAHCDPL